jgi:hypothetical protein
MLGHSFMVPKLQHVPIYGASGVSFTGIASAINWTKSQAHRTGPHV